jgi:signal transduction histidine kinase
VTAPSRIQAFLREHPLVADALLALVLLPNVLFIPDLDRDIPAAALPPVAAVIAVLACAAVAFRRIRPRIVLALTIAGSVAVFALVEGRAFVVLTVMVALYTVANRSDRRTTLIAWALSSLAITAGLAVSQWAGTLDAAVFAFLPWLGVFAAVGDGLRTRRAYVAAVEERADRAERTREEEARRRVAEERLRIARELHDVVAHRIAVVNVQAGVAAHLMCSQPEAAEEALEHVREAGRAVLDELSDILNVLRQPDEASGPTSPAPDLSQVDSLVDSFDAAGLVVDWSVTGRPRSLAGSVDLVAYRVLQEALTNAHKHGSGTAHVALTYTPSALELLVTNPLPGPGSTQVSDRESGFGLIGMHERATAVGGVVSAGPSPDGEFRVEATLPDREVVPT